MRKEPRRDLGSAELGDPMALLAEREVDEVGVSAVKLDVATTKPGSYFFNGESSPEFEGRERWHREE